MKKLSLILASLWLSLVPAAAQQQMPALGAAAAVSGTDLLAIYQGAAPLKKMTAAQMAAYVYGLASGDLTANSTGTHTLATVNANVGSFGSATNCVSFTTNAKGLITAASQTTCTPAVASITGLGTGVSAALAAALNSSTGLVGALTATNGNCIVGNGTAWTSTACPGGTAANPTATAGPTAVNGVASTYMRSDAAPAVQQGSAAQKGIVQVDGTTITASSGVISAVNNGTVTSISTACGLSGGPITTSGTISGGAAVRANTGTTDTILSTDCGKVVTESNAAAVAVTLPQATGSFAAPFAYTQVNLGAGTVTVTPTTSTINGAATLVLTAGQSADIVSDGTNYIAALGKSGGSGTVTTTGSPASGNLAAFSGASSITKGDLSGDCTTSGTLSVTCQGLLPPNYKAQWYIAFPPAPMTTGLAFTASQIYCRLFQFPRVVTFTNVGLNLTTGAAAGNIQVAFYTNDASTNLPGALIQNTASISTATNGNKSGALGGAVQLGPGGSSGGRDVWGCVNSDNATHIANAYSSNFTLMGALMGAPTQAGIMQSGGSGGLDNISCNGANCNGGSSTYNTWPASLVGSTWTYNNLQSRFPALMFQVTSSP